MNITHHKLLRPENVSVTESQHIYTIDVFIEVNDPNYLTLYRYYHTLFMEHRSKIPRKYTPEEKKRIRYSIIFSRNSEVIISVNRTVF